MKLKSKAHEPLSMLFKRNGVPPKIVVDNSKEQSLGKFVSKFGKTDCHLVNTESYSPGMMAPEGCMRQLKGSSS